MAQWCYLEYHARNNVDVLQCRFFSWFRRFHSLRTSILEYHWRAFTFSSNIQARGKHARHGTTQFECFTTMQRDSNLAYSCWIEIQEKILGLSLCPFLEFNCNRNMMTQNTQAIQSLAFSCKRRRARFCYLYVKSKWLGRSLKHVDADLRARPCFAYGHWSVALSRVIKVDNLYIIAPNGFKVSGAMCLLIQKASKRVNR